ncbi:MAG: response regulator [Gammaproteobacteria bacterium]
MSKSFKILIAEDHDLYRDGLQLLVQDLGSAIEVIEAADFPTTLRQLHENADIQLLLLDIKLPGTQELDGLHQIRQLYPILPIIVVSTLDLNASVHNMLRFGANGFIAKATPKQEMVAAIRSVLAGEVVVLTENHDQELVEFPPRQMATLRLLAQGLSNKAIASRLGITPATVREYVSVIMQQLGVDNRVQAVLAAKERGFILD